jgi:hypothetical protein
MFEDEEDVRRATGEDSIKPMELDGEAVSKVPYDEEQENTKPIGFVFVNAPPESEKPGGRDESADPQMSYVPSAQLEGTDPNTSRKRKRKSTETQ